MRTLVERLLSSSLSGIYSELEWLAGRQQSAAGKVYCQSHNVRAYRGRTPTPVYAKKNPCRLVAVRKFSEPLA